MVILTVADEDILVGRRFAEESRTWRESDDPVKQLRVGRADGQGVGRAVGKTHDADPRRIDGNLGEQIGERGIDGLQILAVAGLDVHFDAQARLQILDHVPSAF